MTMQLKFTPDTLSILNDERYSHPVPIVQRRMEALWLKSHNLPHSQIAALVGVCENTLRDYFELYQEGGIEGLKTVRFHRPGSELDAHITSLEAYFKEHPPATIKKAQYDIETLTGIRRSRTQVRVFLKKKLHLRCRKIGMIPAKADPDQQAEYLEHTLEPRLNEAAAGQRAVFFVDAAHFVLAPFLGFLWSAVRLFIRAPAGRQRFNVLGALNAITHELIAVTNDTYITSKEVCELLQKLTDLPNNLPITLFLDNARYQKCALVIETAARLHIELCFLPSYSPNLNLIERLWRFVKKECLYSTYYPSFSPFKAAITDCLDQTHSKHKTALDSLLTLRFQRFEKTQIMSV